MYLRLTSSVEDIVHPSLGALFGIPSLHETFNAILGIQQTTNATFLALAGQVRVLHVHRKVLRRAARTTGAPMSLLRSVGHHLVVAVVRDHLVLGGTVVLRQTSHVVLETADGRLPQLDLGLILGWVGALSAMHEPARSRGVVRVAQHLERVGGLLELELIDELRGEFRGRNLGRIGGTQIVAGDAVTVAAGSVRRGRRWGGMAVQEVDREVVAGVGSHCREDPCDRAKDCRQDAAHSVRGGAEVNVNRARRRRRR